VYDGKIASLINAMKNGKRRLAAFFGEYAAESFYENFQAELTGENAVEWLLIPVPLTDAAKKKRGYNQAAEMGRNIEKVLRALGVKVTMDESGLEKKRDTPSQKRLSFLERQENLKGSFHVHKRSVCKGRDILLVDDVMTTGVTLESVADKLKRAGASEVYGLVVASVTGNNYKRT
jgi:predicted amidophosphoribosyltransferase